MRHQRPPVDWGAAQALYVNDQTQTYKTIAERFNSTEPVVRVYANRHDWRQERERRSATLLREATRKSVNAMATELAKWNEQDIAVAKLGRNLAAKKLQAALKDGIGEKELRQLMGSLESAQRIARLAMGATTENVMNADALQMSEANVEGLSDDDLVAFQQLLIKTFRGSQPRDSETGSASVQ